ncbi:glutamine--tRNA ligase/YqeY domain fusion protein [Psychrobacter urativorans]|uniref:glutamine--tRNA ligase/YqeY domain fusion protein n=1 Tax=Psychrobacter urativorans TaxID=45610 RepID=UPI00191A85FF|nr:glutamine--tRNA ligase/YqeY domain fusion protein [Psychrobacter urativorans]
MSEHSSNNKPKDEPKNDFIRNMIREDVKTQKYKQIVTRFPPEPNGYLHLGHVKSICLNFGVAEEFNGICHLRYDDTNPTAEKQDYIDNIKKDVHWLGFEWAGKALHASSYFDQLYAWAIQLIEQGEAYVDLQMPEQIKDNRGSYKEAGTASPQRDASVADNLQLFNDMKNGKYADGKAVLRAKIDMSDANMNMRDPIVYRVMHQEHHQTGDKWCIYPMYDFAHPLSDAIEGITHSLCTLEFEDHRPFYDWIVNKIGFEQPPHQYEFSRLNVDHTLTSKRKLKQLVDEGIVDGWDDPRMPTVAGMRRRGYTPEGLRDFCDRVGVAKADGVVDMRLLEFSIRQSLDDTTARGMAVLKPLKVTITNFSEAVSSWESQKADSVNARWDDESQTLWLTQPNHPNIDMGEREIPFTETLYIDQGDYEIEPPADYKRLSPEKTEIRLRNTYVLAVTEHITNDKGQVIELKATIDPATLGNNPEGRKVKGVIHWVSASLGVPATVRLYESLFSVEDPSSVSDVHAALNPNSSTELAAVVEPSLANAEAGTRFQFEREGYFISDVIEHSSEYPVFNQIVSLRDSYKPA